MMIMLPEKINDNQIVSGSRDKTIKILDLSTGKCLKTLTGQDDNVTSIVKLNDTQIASGSRDKRIKI